VATRDRRRDAVDVGGLDATDAGTAHHHAGVTARLALPCKLPLAGADLIASVRTRTRVARLRCRGDELVVVGRRALVGSDL
jgi:hypothetical protein